MLHCLYFYIFFLFVIPLHIFLIRWIILCGLKNEIFKFIWVLGILYAKNTYCLNCLNYEIGRSIRKSSEKWRNTNDMACYVLMHSCQDIELQISRKSIENAVSAHFKAHFKAHYPPTVNLNIATHTLFVTSFSN